MEHPSPGEFLLYYRNNYPQYEGYLTFYQYQPATVTTGTEIHVGLT
jgi:hypothetical protein